MALTRLARFDDADRVLADALTQHPDDRDIAYAQANVMLARGRLPQAVKRLEPLTVQAVEPVDLNNVAWLKLAEATDLKGALALAQRGVQARPEEPHVLNTIAAIEAELGQLGEAKQHLAKSVEAKSLARPDDSDLYVQGRILEQLGLVDDAIAIYRQLKPVTSGTFTPEASDLARKRLQALGVKK